MARTLIKRYFQKAVSMKEKSIINCEDGNVLILSLILLVLLTMIGISATRTSSIDIQVAGNNMIYTRNLFSGEVAAYEAVQNLELTNISTANLNWLLPQGTYDVLDNDEWDNGFSGGTAGTAAVSGIDLDSNATIRFVAVNGGLVDTGESLDMTRTKVNSFTIYGRCDRANGTSVVELGYRKAF